MPIIESFPRNSDIDTIGESPLAVINVLCTYAAKTVVEVEVEAFLYYEHDCMRLC